MGHDVSDSYFGIRRPGSYFGSALDGSVAASRQITDSAGASSASCFESGISFFRSMSAKLR